MALSAWLVWRGVAARDELRVVGGIAIAGTGIAFFLLLDFWGEMLWFEALGHTSRFWSMLWAQGEAVVLGAALGFGGVYLLLRPLRQRFHLARCLSALGGGIGGGVWGIDSWDELVLFAHRVHTGLREPMLDHETGFYLFVLPLLDQVFALLLWIVIVALLAAAAVLFVRREPATGRFLCL